MTVRNRKRKGRRGGGKGGYKVTPAEQVHRERPSKSGKCYL